MAEYPSPAFTVSKLLARRRRLKACLRSGSSSTTIIFARFMGCPSLLLSVRILVVLLFGEVVPAPKTLLNNFGDIIGNAKDLLFQGPRVGGGRGRNPLRR